MSTLYPIKKIHVLNELSISYISLSLLHLSSVSLPFPSEIHSKERKKERSGEDLVKRLIQAVRVHQLWSVMAGTSSQGFELNRSDRGPEAETSESQEALKDVSYEMVQGSFKIALPPPSESLEPYIGMEFKSLEVARSFYEIYGIHQGFTIRNAHSRRSQKDNSIIGKEYVCSKEGFRAKKYQIKERKTLPPRPVTREGCNAMLRIAKKDWAKWVVTGFVREHSHELNPHKVPSLTLQMNAFGEEDERDKKIRELSMELQHEKKLHAACKRRLDMILKYTEEHTQNLSLKVDVIVNNIRELESDEQDVTPHR